MESQRKLSASGVGRLIILCLAGFVAAMTPTVIHAQSGFVPIPPEAVLSEDWNANTAKSAPAYRWDRSADIAPFFSTSTGATWVEQGPGPILFDSNTVVPPDSPVVGAINVIAASPTNPNILYVGAVNGGIWRTTNATAISPTWSPLTDQQLPALSINSLALSPVDANTLFGAARVVSASRAALALGWPAPRMAATPGRCWRRLRSPGGQSTALCPRTWRTATWYWQPRCLAVLAVACSAAPTWATPSGGCPVTGPQAYPIRG